MSSCKSDTILFNQTTFHMAISIDMTLMASSQLHGRCLCSDLLATSNQVCLMVAFRGGSLKGFRARLGLWWEYRGASTQHLPWHQKESEVGLAELSSYAS